MKPLGSIIIIFRLVDGVIISLNESNLVNEHFYWSSSEFLILRSFSPRRERDIDRESGCYSSDVMTVGWVEHRVRQSVCDTHSSMSTIPHSPRASLSTRICTCHVAACILHEMTVRWFHANLVWIYNSSICILQNRHIGLDVQFSIKRLTTHYNSWNLFI